MADICYYKGTKIILVSRRNARGKWSCRFTIPEMQAPGAGTYEGPPLKEYETEQEAETAAFECSKKMFDSLHHNTSMGGSHRKAS